MPSLVELILFLPLALLVVVYAAAACVGREASLVSAKGGTRLYWLLREYLYYLLYIALALSCMVFDLALKKRRLSPGPGIVLLHGLFSAPVHWLPLALRLRRAGFGNIIRPAYQRGARVDEWARRLAEELRQHEGEIVIIAHSIGGLVAALAAARLPRGKVKKIVTYGTPFGGSLMARFAFSPPGRRLRPGSALLHEAEEAIRESGAPLVCFWSAFDQLVVPGESAALPFTPNIEMAGLGHTGYHFSREVAEKTITLLKEDGD